MDEPLSNLDAKLRVQMRAELKRLHQELRSTVIYVTHDQMEAMTMADQIAVMSGGVVQQMGTPDEIYESPTNTFVAGFVGSPAMNFVPAEVVVNNGTTSVHGDGWQLPLSPANSARAKSSQAGQVILGVRHGHMKILTDTAGGDGLPGKIYTVEPTGDLTYVHAQLGEHFVVASTTDRFRGTADQPVRLGIDQEHLYLFDATTGKAL
jgi:multiple sugar transport system ATP-binding protein